MILSSSLRRITTLLFSIAVFLLSSHKAIGQCPPPVLEGPHSMCTFITAPNQIYSVSNFNSANSYLARKVVNGVSTSINVNPNGQFNVNLASANMAMVIVDQLSPCISADTIYVQPCCSTDPAGANVLTDASSATIPGIVDNFQNGTHNYIYNPLIAPFPPATVVIHGQLTISDVTEFYNCNLLMDQGASIRVKSSKEFVIYNSQISAFCNAMWEGVICDDGSKFKTRQNATLIDAQYGFSMTGHVIMDIGSNVQILNSYAGIYCPPNTAGNAPDLVVFSNGLSLTIDRNANLLPGYYGQFPAPQTKPYAGLFFNDVSNFSTFDGSRILNIAINNCNLGFASFRSNITIPYGFTTNTILPTATGATTQEYNWSKSYNGSAVYCEATTAIPGTLSIGLSASQNANLINCKFGVHVNNNMNLNCQYNNFQNISGKGGVKVNNCKGKTIDILHNHFTNGFLCGIYCFSLANSTLHILDNTLDNGPIYDPLNYSISFAYTGIYVANKNSAVINGSINNNHITASRIGIYLANTKGSSVSNKFLVQNNEIIFNRAYANLYKNPPSTIDPWNHFGIWLEMNENTIITSNLLNRSVPLITNINSSYKDMMIGFKIVKSINNTIIKSNTLNDFGTFARVIGNCNGTFFQCNTFLLNANPPPYNATRGVFFDWCSLTDQGSSISPSDNKWQGWGSLFIPNRIEGNLNLVSNPNSILEWYHRSNNNIYSPTPASVGPTFTAPVATGLGPCTSIPPDDYPALVELVNKIVYDQINYIIFPVESRYQDEQWAFNVLDADSILRYSNIDYLAFYTTRVSDNIGDFSEIKDFMEEGDYQVAMDRLSMMIKNNSIDYNLAFTLTIISRLETVANYEITAGDSVELERIAWMTTWEGGEGVINARCILGLEVDDVLQNLRFANPSDEKSLTSGVSIAELYSLLKDPATDKITVFDLSGKLIFSGLFQDLYEKKFNLKSGLYSYQALDHKTIICKGKLMIINY